MKVISIEKRGWLKDTIIFRAIGFEECILGSFMGDKKFWVLPDRNMRIKVPKDWCLQYGDNVRLGSLVMEDQNQFLWDWAN